MTDHPSDDLLREYKAGRLDAMSADDVERHLEACDACGDRFDVLTVDADALLKVMRERQSVAPRDDLSGQGAGAIMMAGMTAGSTLGPYEIHGELGAGGMGVVYLARDRKLNRDVALKLILPERRWLVEDRERFQREAEAAAHLQHANIVQIFDSGEIDGVLYCAFEYVPGGSLRDRLQQGPMSTAETARTIATIAEAVQYAHEHRIVHRDLKPENILLTANGTPKIADFGLARRLDTDSSLTVQGVAPGTPAYMAPEQLDGSQRAGVYASDIYALGAILYECLAGQPVFNGSVMEILDQVRQKDPTFPSRHRPDVSRDLEAVCLKCLQKMPRHRYRQAAEVAHEMQRVLAGLPVQSRRPPWTERLVRTVRRNPVTSALAGLFLVTLSVALVGATWYSLELRQRERETAAALRLVTRNAYTLHLQNATQLASSDPLRAIAILDDEEKCPRELRDFTWRWLRQACRRRVAHWKVDAEVRVAETSRSNDSLAIGDDRGRLWLVATEDDALGQPIKTPHASITDVTFSSGSDQLLTIGRRYNLQDDRDAKFDLCWWSVAERRVIQQVAVPSLPYEAAFWDDDTVVTCHADGQVRFWQLVEDAIVPREVIDTRTGQADVAIYCMDVQRDAGRLAVGRQDGKVQVWSRSAGATIGEIWQLVGEGQDDLGVVSDVAFHPQNPDLIASTGSHRVTLWKCDHATKGGSVEDLVGSYLAGEFGDRASSLSFSADGSRLAAASYDGTLRLWNVDSGQVTFQLSSRGDSPITSVELDGERRIVFGRADGTVERWRTIESLEPAVWQRLEGQSIGHVQVCQVSDTVIAGDVAGQLSVWDRASGRSLFQWKDTNAAADDYVEVTYLDVSPLGQIAWETNGQIYFRDSVQPFSPSVRALIRRYIEALAIGSHGLVLTGASGTQMVDVKTGEPIWDLEFEGDWAAISRDAPRLVLASSSNGSNGSRLWIGSPNGSCETELTGPAQIACLDLSADGTKLVVGTRDGRMIVYDLETGTQSTIDLEVRREITSVAFSTNGGTLVSATRNGQLCCWDVSMMHRIVQQSAVNTEDLVVRSMTFGSDDHALYCACSDGTVRILAAP